MRTILCILLGLAAASLAACSMELPKPPPKLHYKFNVLNVGLGPAQLLTADLNKDGNDDIVSVNSKDSTLTVLLGRGDGTFAPASTLPVLAEPTSVAMGDVNGDGLIDLVANARGAEAVSIVLASGPGVFQRARKHRTGKVPLAVILDDFDGDGRLDLAVPLTFDKMEIHLGQGGGLFKRGMTYSTGSRSFSGVSGDFDEDGHRDIVLATSSSQASAIRLFRGRGDGTFAKPTRMIEGLRPLVLIKKDMNGDGREDLIAASGQGDNLYLLLSRGDGTFDEATAFSGGGGPMALVADHFNDDARMDVAVANSRSSSFSMVVRRDDGGFWFPTRDYIVEGGTPLAITSGDYNSDGLRDIAVASNAKNTVEIYLRRRFFR